MAVKVFRTPEFNYLNEWVSTFGNIVLLRKIQKQVRLPLFVGSPHLTNLPTASGFTQSASREQLDNRVLHKKMRKDHFTPGEWHFISNTERTRRGMKLCVGLTAGNLSVRYWLPLIFHGAPHLCLPPSLSPFSPKASAEGRESFPKPMSPRPYPPR